MVATIVVVMFGGMSRYDDASGLMCLLEADGSAFEITFDKRKNSQYRQDKKVLVTPSRTMQFVQYECYSGCGCIWAERRDSTSSADSTVG